MNKLDYLFKHAVNIFKMEKNKNEYKLYEVANGMFAVLENYSIIATFTTPEHAQEYINYVQRKIECKKFWIREVVHEVLTFIQEKEMMEFCKFKPDWDNFNEDEFMESFLEYYKKEWDQ